MSVGTSAENFAGLVKGKQIGDGLMYLLNLVLEKPELNKKDILLEKINQFKEK